MAFTGSGVPLGEAGGPASPPIQVAPRQMIVAPGARATAYVLGTDGIVRVDFDNTPPPPQGGEPVDWQSLLTIAGLVAILAVAVLSRRGRGARRGSIGAALEGPVGLRTKNGTQRQDEHAKSDQQFLVAHQTERKEQAAHEDDQAKHNAEAHEQ
jgi:hypothetical protein